MKIENLLSKRTDLSSFLIHLTRTHEGSSAKERLEKILEAECLKLDQPMGQAVKALNRKNESTDSQRCVCFTETPLENIKFMLGEIDGRTCQFEPYGVAITKRAGRRQGVNPVWYVNITSGGGYTWMTKPLNTLIDEALSSGKPFEDSPIAKITPFIEQMGSGATSGGDEYQKNFWWEREWRSTSSIDLPLKFIVLCPEEEIKHFKSVISRLEISFKPKCVDPRWSQEKIIASLAGLPWREIHSL